MHPQPRPSILLNNLLRSIRNDDLSLAEYGRLLKRVDSKMDVLCTDSWADRTAFVEDLHKHYGGALSYTDVFGSTLGAFLRLLPKKALLAPPKLSYARL